MTENQEKNLFISFENKRIKILSEFFIIPWILIRIAFIYKKYLCLDNE